MRRGTLTGSGIRVWVKGPARYETAHWFKAIDERTGENLLFVPGDDVRARRVAGILGDLGRCDPNAIWHEVAYIMRSGGGVDLLVSGGRSYRLEPCADYVRVA